jgi:hypothetical protein
MFMNPNPLANIIEEMFENRSVVPTKGPPCKFSTQGRRFLSLVFVVSVEEFFGIYPNTVFAFGVCDKLKEKGRANFKEESSSEDLEWTTGNALMAVGLVEKRLSTRERSVRSARDRKGG